MTMQRARTRTLTRLSAVGCMASVAAASWFSFLAPRADALTQPGITVTKDESVTVEFGPIVGSNPANEAKTPDICATSAYCDAIPLEVVVPESVGPDDEYFLQVLMEWDTRQLPGDPVLEPDGYALNDMDMFIYTDPPTVAEVDRRGNTPDSDDDPFIANGATGTQPEKAFLFKPEGDYLLSIVNFLGVNTGYKITVTWVSEAFPSPFESLAPDFVPSTTTPRPRPTSPVTTVPFTPPTTSASSPTLAPIVVAQDDDFAFGQFDTSDFDDQLAAPPPLDLTPIASTPEDPSGAALFFWLLAVPFGLLTAGGFFVLRNRAAI